MQCRRHAQPVWLNRLICYADDAFENMYVVYATGQYITGPNDDGGLRDTVTFQQASK